MSHRFFRCRLCGLPHELGTTMCPVTGQRLPSQRMSPQPVAQAVPVPVVPPVAAPVKSALGTNARVPRPSSPPQPVVAPEKSATLEAHIGEIIGKRYLIEGTIAQGGMGIVLRARHLELGKMFALKLLTRQSADDPDAVARFRNEARLAGSLGHPNIVEISDLGTCDDGSPYLVMELLQGESLADRLKREPMQSLSFVHVVTEQVLSALSATHAQGIMHRDLKPENLFLVDRGAGAAPHVKLVDFGISKIVRRWDDDSDHGLTRTGFIMGTPSYMAPEQARGDRDLDGRVDLWATGVMCYQMLVGRLPFVSKQLVGLLTEMSRTRPARIRSVRSDVSEALENCVFKLMSVSVRERFRTADIARAAWSEVFHEAVQTPTAERSRQKAHPPRLPVDDDSPTEVNIRPRAIRPDADSSQGVQVFSLPPKKPGPT